MPRRVRPPTEPDADRSFLVLPVQIVISQDAELKGYASLTKARAMIVRSAKLDDRGTSSPLYTPGRHEIDHLHLARLLIL